MISAHDRYQTWLKDPYINEGDMKKLKELSSDSIQLKDHFYQDLVFGTAGLRGKLGIGTNRMNQYMVSKAALGLAKVIEKKGDQAKQKGVAISFDNRNFSKEFAFLTASIMAFHEIKVFIYETLRSTPQLSFTIRHFQTIAGVNVTASHNPKEYNGYKVYWEDGSQIKSDIANLILEEMNQIKDFSILKKIEDIDPYDNPYIQIIGKEVDTLFIDKVIEQSIQDDIDFDIKVVYTPLHGTGLVPVTKVLEKRGFTNIHVVEEQKDPDGNFPTIDYPNPEEKKAFYLSEKLAKKIDADIMIATDPDADRLAIAAKNDNQYFYFNGNQAGVILIQYLLEAKKNRNQLPANGAIVKSIVTGEMGTAICHDYGVEMVNVLTGFKNICALANQWEDTHEKTYLMGYEESIGYNVGTFVRDKDAVTSALLFIEAAAYYQKKGKTLVEVLFDLFNKYGYYQEKTISLLREGLEGKKQIQRMMETFPTIYPKQIGDSALVRIIDYNTSMEQNLQTNQTKPIAIEKTNAYAYYYEDDSFFALRPSGTEPKIKIYLYVKDKDLEKAKQKLSTFERVVLSTLESIKH